MRVFAVIAVLAFASCSGGTSLGDAGAEGGAGSGGGSSCGTKTCPAGGTCCYACISECAGPGEACKQYLVDPCKSAATAQPCSDKSPTCPSGQVCDLNQPGRCAASTVAGTCIVKPDACTLDDAPVCACGGKTYGNDCERQAAGAQLEHTGACT
jgi:hypothetical protein